MTTAGWNITTLLKFRSICLAVPYLIIEEQPTRSLIVKLPKWYVLILSVKMSRLQQATSDFKTESNTQIKYNPREMPFWNVDGVNHDGNYYEELFTIDYKVFVK